MRPNYAQDAPPTEISVGGFRYRCAVDYRIWIDVLRLMRAIEPEAQDAEQRVRNLEIICEIQHLVFGGVLADEDPAEVLEAVAEFSKGYPAAPVRAEEASPTFSFEYDLNAIVIAIRNQSGIDLSYRRREPFHWWEFLLEFQTLCGDHYILNLMEARSYRGRDKELLRRKRMCALPTERRAADRSEMDVFSAMFDVEGNAARTDSPPASYTQENLGRDVNSQVDSKESEYAPD